MTIPKLHYIAEGDTPKVFLENIQKACTSGAELVQLHFKNASEKKVLKLAKEAIKITSHFQTRLIINEFYKVAKEIKADGVHLEKTNSSPAAVRKHLHSWQIIGSTASDLQTCKTLIKEQVDYIILAPFKTENSSNNKALGLNGFAEITKALNTQTPIIGFGNITTSNVPEILETGVSGIAVSQAITQNFDVIKTFNQLLNASATQEQRHTFK